MFYFSILIWLCLNLIMRVVLFSLSESLDECVCVCVCIGVIGLCVKCFVCTGLQLQHSTK